MEINSCECTFNLFCDEYCMYSTGFKLVKTVFQTRALKELIVHCKENSHDSVIGKNYITIPISHSWERIPTFTP